ncbi:BMP family ABC transporter substrate-binding protein, partial [Rhizobium ruizarguesonis]
AAPLKVAGIHASPVDNAWNSCLHKALQDAAKAGVIEYVFSEGVSGPDYPRAMREYAEQGNTLIIGEAYAVEKEARQ